MPATKEKCPGTSVSSLQDIYVSGSIVFVSFHSRQLTKEAGRDMSQQTKTDRALLQPNELTCHLTEVRNLSDAATG